MISQESILLRKSKKKPTLVSWGYPPVLPERAIAEMALMECLVMTKIKIKIAIFSYALPNCVKMLLMIDDLV